MFQYKVQFQGEDLEKYDEELLIGFFQMLDFSAEFLSEIYDAEKIKFCPEGKKIRILEEKKHEKRIDEVAAKYGFGLENV